MKTKAELDSLKQLGELSRIVKKKILAKIYKVDTEIYKYLDHLCDRYNLEFAFPPLICADYVISHVAIDPKNPINLGKTRLYTIDFGFRDKKTGMIVDNSITVVNQPSLERYVTVYDEYIKKVVENLSIFLKKKGFITAELVSHWVDKLFNSGQEDFFVVPFACSHTIKKNQLHGQTIFNTLEHLRKNDQYKYREEHYKMPPGTCFTIEPHVLIIDKKYKNESNLGLGLNRDEDNESQKSNPRKTPLEVIKYAYVRPNIAYLKNKKRYVLLEDVKSQNIPKDKYDEIKGILSNYLSFFNENTFMVDFNSAVSYVT